MRAQVSTAEAALQNYRTANNLAAIGESQNIILQKMASLGTALVKAQLEQIDAKSLLDKIDEYQRAGRDLLEIPQISGAVGNLNTTLMTQVSQRTMLSEHYLPAHPKVTENELQIKETRRMLDESIARRSPTCAPATTSRANT